MAGSIESTVVIGRPVDEVFSYVLDLAKNGPDWAPDLESVKQTSEGPVKAGTTFEQVQTVMGKRRSGTLQFIAIDPNRSIEAAGNMGPVAPTARATFEEATDGTRLTIRGNANPKGVFKLLSPVMAKQGQRMWDARLAQLKSVMEGSGTG